MNTANLLTELQNLDFAQIAKNLYALLGNEDEVFAFYNTRAEFKCVRYAFNDVYTPGEVNVGYLCQQQIIDILLEDLTYTHEHGKFTDKSEIPATVRRHRIESYLVDVFITKKQNIIERAL